MCLANLHTNATPHFYWSLGDNYNHNFKINLQSPSKSNPVRVVCHYTMRIRVLSKNDEYNSFSKHTQPAASVHLSNVCVSLGCLLLFLYVSCFGRASFSLVARIEQAERQSSHEVELNVSGIQT